MPDTVVKDIEQYTEINYLTSETAEFERTDGGFLSLTTKDGRKYPRVDLYRAFPFTKPREYISVREPESKEIGVKAKEIGVIRCLDDFPENIAKLIEEQLDRRYFSPVIIKINNINNALERALFQFSCFEREVDYDTTDKDLYYLSIFYYEFEKEEVLSRIFSLGRNAVVIEPEEIRAEIIERLMILKNKYHNNKGGE